MSRRNQHLWPIFNRIGPLKAKLVIIVILFAGHSGGGGLAISTQNPSSLSKLKLDVITFNIYDYSGHNGRFLPNFQTPENHNYLQIWIIAASFFLHGCILLQANYGCRTQTRCTINPVLILWWIAIRNLWKYLYIVCPLQFSVDVLQCWMCDAIYKCSSHKTIF